MERIVSGFGKVELNASMYETIAQDYAESYLAGNKPQEVEIFMDGDVTLWAKYNDGYDVMSFEMVVDTILGDATIEVETDYSPQTLEDYLASNWDYTNMKDQRDFEFYSDND